MCGSWCRDAQGRLLEPGKVWGLSVSGNPSQWFLVAGAHATLWRQAASLCYARAACCELSLGGGTLLSSGPWTLAHLHIGTREGGSPSWTAPTDGPALYRQTRHPGPPAWHDLAGLVRFHVALEPAVEATVQLSSLPYVQARGPDRAAAPHELVSLIHALRSLRGLPT